MSFTPGPWELYLIGKSKMPVAIVRRCDQGIVSVLHPPQTPSDRTPSDMRLAAAAPELLAALELVVSRCGPRSKDGAIARAAIAKARGVGA